MKGYGIRPCPLLKRIIKSKKAITAEKGNCMKKTLEECKEEYAVTRGYASWKSLMRFSWDSVTVGDMVNKSLSEVAELYADQFKPKWIPVSSLTYEPGIEVIGFNESWIDEDVNPEGTCLCFFQATDPGYWVISKYCNYHDEWHTRYSHEAEEELGKEFGGHDYIDAPTHFMFKPAPPLPPAPERKEEGGE